MADERLNQASSGLAVPIRRAISRMVLDLREALEEDFRRQLTALGVRENGLHPLPVGRSLASGDQRARDVAVAVVERKVRAGLPLSEAVERYVAESAFTFLNRAVGLRCLDERGLLIVDGQPETAIKSDPSRRASSLYWRARNDLGPQANPREVWRETLRRAGEALSQQVRVLFDPRSEHAALFPLQPTVTTVVEALNSPEIPPETYAQDELLGWVYQYYNAREKDAVYAKLGRGQKIENPEELAAATCLYTERYMVDYLLQNTLGALWVEMHPDSRLPEQWPYYVRPAEGNAFPKRDNRPLRDISLLDPACGSGQFLLRAFDLFAQMYREEGRESEAEIPHLIIERNLHGVDIDLRAIQIAALGLYLKGCALAGPGFRLRQLNLVPADAVLPANGTLSGFLARFQGDQEAITLVHRMWERLQKVRELGSLVHLEGVVDEVIRRRRERDRVQTPLFQDTEEEWDRWKRNLLEGLKEEFECQAEAEDLGQRLFGEHAARGVSLVEALGGKYDVVVANPPYAGGKNLNAGLKQFVEREYKEGKRDLYAAFILRCRDFAKADGYVGMVTQQSWMFLRSYSSLRRDVLENNTVMTIAHLGPRAFEEIGGEVVNIALFSLRSSRPNPDHRMVGFRLVGPKSPSDKDNILRRAMAGQSSGVVSTPRQADFLPIPETPFVYWLRPRFFELLRSSRRLRDVAEVCQGLRTTDNERFMRFFWEVDRLGTRWFNYSKGGQYQKWYGSNWYVVDFENDGQGIKDSVAIKYPYLGGKWEWVVGSRDRYFQPGLCYSCNCRGSLGLRELKAGSIFDPKGPAIFASHASSTLIMGLLSSRTVSYILRATVQGLDFNPGYVANAPVDVTVPNYFEVAVKDALGIKTGIVSNLATELSFTCSEVEITAEQTLGNACNASNSDREMAIGQLHATEGYLEHSVCNAFELDPDDIQAVISETGTPAGWYPIVTGYAECDVEGFPSSSDLESYLRSHRRISLPSHQLTDLKARLRTLYQAGPGGNVPGESSEDGPEVEEEETSDVVFGARIPVPAETFLEQLSQKLEIHPISVYWLLKEMREQEGLVSPPELKRYMEDYASISLIRMLGYRWPEQDAYEKENGPILDPDLVDEDGIIPLVPCGDEPTAEQRIHLRLERDFGEEGALQSAQEFRRWVGRDIGEWLKKDFFKRHVQQFKQRPIAWHFVSPERTFEAFVLYHRLSLTTLEKLRAQYAGNLIARLRGEQERAKQRQEEKRVRELHAQIEDVEEFRKRIEAIERGSELKHRIRCRWKGETGRPGPYSPDTDDGVKVNIRPFQEAGLLAVKEVIKKW